MKHLLLAALLLVCPLAAQSPTYQWQTTNSQGVPSKVIVPTTSTTVVSATANYVKVDAIVLRNTSASAVTVTISDLSSNCNGSPCSITPGALSIAANTLYILKLNGEPASGGVQWSASTANAVIGWMGGRY